MSATMPSVVIQSYLTITAKRFNQFPTITLTGGATAGSEVVTVASDLSNVNIQIQSGTSTMAQVAAAINKTVSISGSLNTAGDLLSAVVTSGHNSTTMLAGSAIFSGGTVVSAASVTIGHMVYTAQTPGTAGNSITIAYSAGTTNQALQVTVVGSAIAVRLAGPTNGSYPSTNTLIAAAIANSSPANALVACTSDGLAMSYVPSAAIAASPISLVGGTAAVSATAVLQDITFTAIATGTAANGKIVTYANTVNAGSETTSISSGNLTVNIQSGVSTATQVHAASIASLYTSSITGTAGNAQIATASIAMTGAIADPRGQLGCEHTASDITLTTSFQYIPFYDNMSNVLLTNDDTIGTNTLIFSWDGISEEGRLYPTQHIAFDQANKSGVFVAYVTGSPAFRLIASAK